MLTSSLDRLRQRITRPRSGDARRTARDRSLTHRLYATFERELELADVQGIHFYVQNGTVTLYGTVRHELDLELLVSLVRQIPGVKGVVPNLQIVATRFQETPEPRPLPAQPDSDPAR